MKEKKYSWFNWGLKLLFILTLAGLILFVADEIDISKNRYSK